MNYPSTVYWCIERVVSRSSSGDIHFAGPLDQALFPLKSAATALVAKMSNKARRKARIRPEQYIRITFQIYTVRMSRDVKSSLKPK